MHHLSSSNALEMIYCAWNPPESTRIHPELLEFLDSYCFIWSSSTFYQNPPRLLGIHLELQESGKSNQNRWGTVKHCRNYTISYLKPTMFALSDLRFLGIMLFFCHLFFQIMLGHYQVCIRMAFPSGSAWQYFWQVQRAIFVNNKCSQHWHTIVLEFNLKSCDITVPKIMEKKPLQ